MEGAANITTCISQNMLSNKLKYLANLPLTIPNICSIISNILSNGGGDVMELDNNNHSVFLMYYHLVLVIKYRRKVIDEEVSARLKEIFDYIAPNYNIII